MKKGYKLCPYCANEIKEAAIKCQYCGEFLKKEERNEEGLRKLINSKKECPFCLNVIDEDEKQCPFCEETYEKKIKKSEECGKGDKRMVDKDTETIKPNKEGIYLCPDCGKEVKRGYSNCENCWNRLEWSDEDISFAIQEAKTESKKKMDHSFIVTIILILAHALMLATPGIGKILFRLSNEFEVKVHIFGAIIIFGIMAVCMKMFNNRIAFIFMFIDYLISFFIKLADETILGKGMALIVNAFLICVFYKGMCGSFIYRNIEGKKKLSVDEWVLLIIGFIAIIFIIIGFIVEN